MTGIFGSLASIQADVNLIFQIVMILIIIWGIFYKRKLKFKKHAILMGIAVILHIISFISVMGPSFSASYKYITTTTSELGVQTLWIHTILGAIAMILGVILVGAWALSPSNIAECSRRKRFMDATLLFWLISLIYGIASYVIFYF